MSFCLEQPKWTLMMNPLCPRKLQPVLQEDEALLVQRGWIPIVRESEILPFNPPRIVSEGDPA